jgi:hypothetical protein
MSNWTRGIAVWMLALAMPLAAWAQNASMTQADLDRLQDQYAAVMKQVEDLRATDMSRANRVSGDLELVRDDIAYLRVRLRRENDVPRSEYTAVRTRLDTIQREVSGTDLREVSPTRRGSNEIAVGQELDARLQTPLSSETAEVEDRFEATTLVDLYSGDMLLVPAGSVLRGVVSGVEKASRTDRRGRLTLSFDQMTVDRQTYRIRATVTQALEGEGLKGEVGKMTTGAAAGAIIGGILGGFKGAIAGVLIGGGGTVLATPGTNVDLAAGTVLRVRFDAPVLIEADAAQQ